MRNMSRQLSIEERVECLALYVLKVRRSGYVEATTQGILESGLTLYYRKLRTELQGGPRLNARDEKATLARRRAKLGGSEKWFARRRGGDRETETKEQSWRNAAAQKDPQAPRKDRRNHRRMSQEVQA